MRYRSKFFSFFFFGVWISTFPSTVCWKDCSFLPRLSWSPWPKWIEEYENNIYFPNKGIFMDPQFCSTNLCVYSYSSAIKSWLLILSNQFSCSVVSDSATPWTAAHQAVFLISFEIGDLFQDCSGYSASVEFPPEFYDQFVSFSNSQLEFW